MAWFVSQSLIFILLAFILGVIAGRLSVRPETKTETVAGIDDELERIEGIGPAMANALRAAGIRTFDQLATSSDDATRDAVRAAGLSFAPSLHTWSRQARLLADGDEAAFQELTARLVAGRDTSRPAATDATGRSGAAPGQAGSARSAGKPRPRPRPRPSSQDLIPDAGGETANSGTNDETRIGDARAAAGIGGQTGTDGPAEPGRSRGQAHSASEATADSPAGTR